MYLQTSARQLDGRKTHPSTTGTLQAINIFLRLHYPSYNSLITRTRSFEHADWPETNPHPISLAEAGFFYDHKLITFNNILQLMLNHSRLKLVTF
jgi:hypothetical protein